MNQKHQKWLVMIFALSLQIGTLHAAARNPEEIIATAQAHLNSSGKAWAAGEAQRLRSGEIDALQVEKDATAVSDGLVQNAVPDELVLIALVGARTPSGASANQAMDNMEGAPVPDNKPGKLDRAKLEQRITSVLEALGDTQRPSPPPH